MKGEKGKRNSPLSRKRFLHVCGSVAAGAAVACLSAVSLRRWARAGREADCFWQIDPEKCTFCGRCETECVLPVSAVKCLHASRVCGYCDLCGGYYRTNVKELNTAAENMRCPTGAIRREYVEDPYFEYTVDESLCNGCGKCAKGCNSFGNGSLYLQVKRDLCKDCNECALAQACPADAIQRVTHAQAYRFKEL
ncbi:MAG: 4Fe-4S binding protein [Tannerella sp.]|jgi:electron transport complex protein RnfB|nr:4Fe-4S binding protein [Tannerella sp.]